MKHFLHFLKRLFQNIYWGTVMLSVVYGFLVLCNWNLNPSEWNGFSRVLAAIGGLIVFAYSWDAMSNTIKNIKATKASEEALQKQQANNED